MYCCFILDVPSTQIFLQTVILQQPQESAVKNQFVNFSSSMVFLQGKDPLVGMVLVCIFIDQNTVEPFNFYLK
jgi:hypothetical protein